MDAGLASRLKGFDLYPKLNDEFKVKTLGGAVVSLIALLFIIYLFVSELSAYLTVDTVDHLLVDTSRGEKLRINFDVTFPHIPCSLLSLDAMDVSGSHQLDVSHNIKKKPLNANGEAIGEEVKHELGHAMKEEDLKVNGTTKTVPVEKKPEEIIRPPNYCGSCFGAESFPGQCCNTCEEVREVYRMKGWALPPLSHIEQCVAAGQTENQYIQELERKEGCQMYGYLQVNKVAGNFHFAPGKSFQHAHLHIHDLAAFTAGRFNVSHIIHSLSFGEPFPGMVNPLDSTRKSLPLEDGGGMFMYYAKVVPTSYSYVSGTQVNTNQFSVTEHYRPISNKEGQGLPGVFFFYELSPIMVQFAETRQSLAHFLTQLCAILGGIFTVAGMVDRIVHYSVKQLEKKIAAGKLI